MDWFRSYHGAPTDPKFLAIAKRDETHETLPGVASWLWWALEDYASQNADRGSVEGVDLESLAAFSGFETLQLEYAFHAFQKRGMIIDQRLANWDKRQANSTDRVRKHRERLKQNATPETRETPRGEEIRVDSVVAKATTGQDEVFERFWKAYPHRGKEADPKKPAATKFAQLVKAGADPETIIRGAEGYTRAQAGKEPQYNAQAVTWLNQARWEQYAAEPDRPAIVTDDVWRERLAKHPLDRWPAFLGPAPGQPGCKVPSHLLIELFPESAA